MKKTFICSVIFVLIWQSLAFSEQFKISRIEHPALKGRRIFAVAEEAGKTVWATDNQLVVFNADGSEQVFNSGNSPLLEAATVSAAGICDGDIWVTQINSSNGYGIFRFDGQNWETFKDPENEGILNNRIMKIHVDSDRIVWFGHEVQGITRMVEAVPIKFKNTKIIHLFNNRLLSLHTQLTHLWLGSSNGIVRYRSDIKSNYYLNVDTWSYPDFPARAAYCIADYEYGSVAVGTDTGLAIFDGKNWRLLKKDAGIKALPVLHLVKSGKNLWLGSPRGIQLWNKSEASDLLMTDAGLPANRVTAMAIDAAGNLLVGTENGACVVKQEKIQSRE